MSDRFMKDFNGEKIFSLEYDKETLKDMVLEKQEEIEKLNKGYCPIKEKCNKGECDCTNEEYNQMCEENIKLDLETERLKERLDIAQTAYLSLDEKINKAIEYIEENCTEHGEGKWAYRTINADNILNILKGDDKE